MTYEHLKFLLVDGKLSSDTRSRQYAKVIAIFAHPSIDSDNNTVATEYSAGFGD
jgi:hypothetical protein